MLTDDTVQEIFAEELAGLFLQAATQSRLYEAVLVGFCNICGQQNQLQSQHLRQQSSTKQPQPPQSHIWPLCLCSSDCSHSCRGKTEQAAASRPAAATPAAATEGEY